MTDEIKKDAVEVEFEEQRERSGKPIVLKLKKKDKKKNKSKKRYSKGLRELQDAERNFTQISHRSVRSVEKGLSTYRKQSKQSAKDKKDGALRDIIPNSGLAMSRAMSEASAIPFEVAQAVDTKQNRKRLKRQFRSLSRGLRIRRR